MLLKGYATESGTEAYAKRNSGLARDHFLKHQDLWFSSIGLGTYLGDEDDETDRLYAEAAVEALRLGCNVIDTAINYRCQRSERTIGLALRRAIDEGIASREEVVIATKGGFVPFEDKVPLDPIRYFWEAYIRPGVFSASDLVGGCHVMTPRYISDQIERSRRNLGLETMDIYYLHNPETQLQEVSRQEFYGRVREAFELLERAADEGKIRLYGTATWDGYRTDPRRGDYLSLEEMVKIAEEVAGKGNHFKLVQLPCNLAMAEALLYRNQKVQDEWMTVLEAAQSLGIGVVSSASILQGRLARSHHAKIMKLFPECSTDAQRALQFARSNPGVLAALVGMRQKKHVQENLQVARLPRTPYQDLLKLFAA